jgi:hypothetical protein
MLTVGVAATAEAANASAALVDDSSTNTGGWRPGCSVDRGRVRLPAPLGGWWLAGRDSRRVGASERCRRAGRR